MKMYEHFWLVWIENGFIKALVDLFARLLFVLLPVISLLQTGEVARDTDFAHRQNSAGECFTETVKISKLFCVKNDVIISDWNSRMLLSVHE